MSHRTTAVLVTLAACAALGFAGDEPKTYEIEWQDRWKVGQIATVTEHETTDTETTVEGNLVKSEHEVLDATYVVRCDELDAKGDAAKRTVFVRSWKWAKDEQLDESISGLQITIEGKAWKVPEGKTAGSLAKKWLDRRFARDEHDANPLSKLAPSKMTLGQTWKPDRKSVAQAFAESMDDAPFDPAGVEMEIQFVSVEGTPPDASGTFVFKVHLPIRGTVPGLPPGAVVLPGSGVEGAGTSSGPLSTSTMLGTEHMDMTMTMNLEVGKQDKKVAVSRKAKGILDTMTVAGGEIPAPPAPPTAKPPVPGAK